MDKNNLVAWLPFDTSTTADKCGNAWTAYGSPTIENGALKLITNGQYVALDEGITLGGQDFTICCQACMNSGTESYGRIFEFKVGDSDSQRFEVTRYNVSGNLQFCINRGSDSLSHTSNLSLAGKIFDLELDYMHSTSTWRLFVDGQLALTHTMALPSTTFKYPWIGCGKYGGGQWQGTIDNFMIYDGVALHTENFTPPTADDYFRLAMDFDGYAPISLDFDVERVVQNDAYIKPIAQSLKVWLPFDTSTTADKCGNTWTAYGSPTLENGKLKLNGSSYLINSQIAADIDDDIWTIHWRATAAANGERFFFGTFNANYGTSGTGSNKWVSVLWYSGNVSISLYGNDTRAGVSLSQNQEYHYALSYDGTNLRLFIDGALKITKSANIKLGGNFRIGIDPSRNTSEAYFKGSIDEFIILKGVAWTENFTPPTADDYFRLAMELDGYAPISLDFDVERQVNNAAKTWRYVNAGTADDLLTSGTTLTDLPESKSITGTAFYQTARQKCFDVPATDEIWIKFDVYFDGSNRWRAYNDSAGGGGVLNGISAQQTSTSTGILSFFAETNQSIYQGENVCKVNQLQTVLLHMVSGAESGVIEAWVDGTKIYTHTGDVNHGEDFADIYLQSDGAGTFFSNVIISNTEIELGEGWQIFTFDVERQVAKAFDISFDVERQVKNVMPFQLDFDVEIKDILPFTIAADTERKIIVLVDLSADVELLSIVLVDFTADVARNIKANINLYKTDNSQYFSGGSSAPIVIPTQEVVPPATDSEAVTQSIEITIAEQQITDQVKVVTAIPLDIMYPVQGQYLDYCCDMRVERVSKQGVLYTANCCSDLDALLYTQLAYTLKQKTTWYQEGSDGEEQEIETYYPPASEHVEKIANALGLTPVMQFDNFLSTLLFDDLGGLTYADIIRDVFGWSSRVPTHLINCYIRNGKLFVIQRGHESNVIDISGADMTLPIFTHELVRTTWGSSPNTSTETREQVTRNFVPADSITGGGDSGGDSGDDSEKEKSWLNVGSVTVSDSSGTTTTTYSYDSNGILRETVAVFTSRIDSKESSTTTTTNSYNSDKLLSETEVDVSHPYNHTADTRTVTTYGYKTLANKQKFLSTEMVTMYENGKWVDTRVTTKSPTGRGQGATTDNSGNTDTSGNISDDRATPYSEKKAAELIKSLPENATDSDGQFVDGVSLYDSSFPIHDTATLIRLTEALKWLNRKTRETVNLSIYNYPHVIDFNDRILLFGNEYYLVSNRAHTNPRIYNEQNLTLVRWF